MMNATSYGFSPQDFDPSSIPDFDEEFIADADITAFSEALNAPDSSTFASLNDWKPIHRRALKRPQSASSKRQRRKKPRRNRDETREGLFYTIFKWPLLFSILSWILCLGCAYWLTRIYVASYESVVIWRGRRESLRRKVRSQKTYDDWKTAARELDVYLNNDKWKQNHEYAYYDSGTVREALEQLRSARVAIQKLSKAQSKASSLTVLQNIVETCVKSNFVGVENPRLYSETYIGTKDLVQALVDELSECLQLLLNSKSMKSIERQNLAQRLHANYGRTALCLSGGASFAWYHFGVVKALIDQDLLPNVITGTSGGALVAALVATRTDSELKALLVPALAHRIRACSEPWTTWIPRWWRTGARFDSVTWAKQCSWFTRGSLTFREAYERTGRILNVSCIPSDPHSPTILTNVVTAPDCVIWSAVLASAAVPAILNPVPMMSKRADGKLVPFSFGHKWKDGSLRTDVPLKSLNLHFGVTFSIVSQVNPHVNAFFYASKGTVGRPVTHRKGRGWRGGYLGSATETILKLELQKFLKMLRNLELLPRLLGQDWSAIWLQQFSGTITIWPKSRPSDFWYILSDPTASRLARMLSAAQQSTWPKLLFIANRIKLERCIENGLRGEGPDRVTPASFLRRRGIDNLHPLARALPEHVLDSEDDDSDTPMYSPVPQASPGVLEELKRQGSVIFPSLVDYGTAESDDEETEAN